MRETSEALDKGESGTLPIVSRLRELVLLVELGRGAVRRLGVGEDGVLSRGDDLKEEKEKQSQRFVLPQARRKTKSILLTAN